MIYQWKVDKFPVSAQEAGQELERISVQGSLTPENIVDESRCEDAVLHDCFDWNDATAAESYRKMQAREIVRSLVTVELDEAQVPNPVRAFVSIENSYTPISVIMKTREFQEEMLSNALKELKAFQSKYSGLIELTQVFESINLLAKMVK